MLELRVKPSDPLILDRWVDVAYATLWAIYAAWGVTTLAYGLPTLAVNTPEWYTAAWAGCVGVLSIIALFACVSLFFKSKRSRPLAPITKKKIERGAVIALVFFILVYPIFLVIQTQGGDAGRAAISVLAWSYVVFPILRVYILHTRIRAYEAALAQSIKEAIS